MFDFEGAWGMPHDCAYDQDAATARILSVLAGHGVKAMFFVVGRIALERPDLVSLIHGQGHAIGVHGLRHERFDTLSPHAVQAVGQELEAVCEAVREVTGARPTAFRAPYLLGPVFVSDALGTVLVDLGFTWVSNREVRYPVEMFRPDRVRWPQPRHWAERAGVLDPGRAAGAIALLALNAGHLGRDPGLGLRPGSVRWLLGPRGPVGRPCGLVDVPLASPLDCDLLGLPRPTEATPAPMAEYAISVLGQGLAKGSPPYNVNFHDWVIGSANRPAVLERVLASLADKGGFVNARHWRPSPVRGSASARCS